MPRITHCICTGLSFRALHEQATALDLSFDQLCERTEVGQGCGLCEPYVRRTLKTGQTEFDELLTADSIDDRPPTRS